MPASTGLTRLLLALLVAGWLAGLALAQQPPPPPQPPVPSPSVPADPAGPQELARGPVHEAFGQPVLFDPQPGPLAPKAPPPPVEELPPDQKPAGDDVRWVPGHWGYDDEAKDFLWVSGFWRSVPPGRAWVPGYWVAVRQGHQWVSGFWAAAGQAEAEYLPKPPQSLEVGPSTDPSGPDQLWVPGCWVWRETRYLWRPGSWAAAHPEWVWVPAHHEWTPSGYVFLDGYWDFPLQRRGLVFAPVRFGPAYRPGLAYTPRVVLDVHNLTSSLFTRVRYGQYYFGDYYAAEYVRVGFYPWFAVHNSRLGYDPLFAYADWANGRQDAGWEARLREAYYLRRDRADARPPRTFVGVQELARRGGAGGQDVILVRQLTEVSQVRDYPVRLERADVKAWEKQAKEYRKLSEERLKWEERQAKAKGPGKVKFPDSLVFLPPGQAKHAAPPLLPVHQVAPLTTAPGPGTTWLPTPEDVLRPDFDRGKGKGKGKGGGKGKGKDKE